MIRYLLAILRYDDVYLIKERVTSKPLLALFPDNTSFDPFV